MSSQRRIDASRANGARSHGPVTAEGKERSAQNAVRHGLLASNIVITGENAENFRNLLAGYVARFQPVDSVEASLVHQMAAADWRQQRSWAIETAIVNEKIAASTAVGELGRMSNAFTVLASGPELALMHRYEARQSRLFARALQNLVLLRKSQPANHESVPEAEIVADANLPNEPNPISEHPEPAESTPAAPPPPADSPGQTPATKPAAPAIRPIPVPVSVHASLRSLPGCLRGPLEAALLRW